MATSEGIPSSIDIEFLELNDNPYIICHYWQLCWIIQQAIRYNSLRICLMAATGWYKIILGPAQRITSRMRSRIWGR